MNYLFINYQNEVIHQEITNNPEQVEDKLRSQGHNVGGFQLAPHLFYKHK